LRPISDFFQELVLATPKPPKSESNEPATTTTTTASSTSTITANAPAPAKSGVYRPPHFSGSSLKREETGPVKYTRGSPTVAPKEKPKELPPGYDAEDDNKRTKKKKPQQQAPAPAKVLKRL
jgi:hypothetical protein